MGTLEKKALKQYRRTCLSCREIFRPYNKDFYCQPCTYSRYYESMHRRIILPEDYGKQTGFREALQGVAQTAWLCVAVLITVFRAGIAEAAVSEVYKGEASWYAEEACAHNPSPSCPTASGHSLYQLIKEDVPYAATYKYPLRSVVEVCREDDRGRCITAKILDRGPSKRFKRERVVDLREREFRALVKPSEKSLRVVMRRIA